MKIRHILAAALALCISATAATARTVTPFNSDWRFRFAHQFSGPGIRVDLPHTWNAGDALAGQPDYYRGMGVYTKTLKPAPDWAGKKVYLRFEGSNQNSTVFVNDTYAGEHQGGYGAFVVDITDLLRPDRDNEIKVKVSNALDLAVMPLVGDFNMYGGIYRPVSLIVTDPVGISVTDYAGPGLYLTQRSVNKDRADVTASVMVAAPKAHSGNVEAEITVADGDRTLLSRRIPVALDPSGADTRADLDFTLENPRLWDGVRDPHMYSVTARTYSDGVLTDSVTQPLGLRYFSVDPDKGFFLNGNHLQLRGVCRHQERAERGNALYPEHHREDAALMREMGVNAVRLAHYPQSSYFYDLMDSAGIVTWAEIPFIGPGGYLDRGYNAVPAFHANGENQLREMIRQHYNHPAIIFWGLYNELKTHGDNPVPYVSRLDSIAHAEDPGRLTVAASFLEDSNPLNAVPDIIAWNKYYGWYGGGADQMAQWLDSNHATNPAYSIGVSEYGAGASIYHQQDSLVAPNPSGRWHPENWQTHYHKTNWEAIDARPFVWGSFVWNMFDFGAAHRTEGDRDGINDKGLVTHDRKTKKDAFYYYKANWNTDEPFVYIAARRNTDRTLPTTDITVFSNQPLVTLTLNGKNLGTRTSDGHGTFTWTGVTLAPGANTVSAAAPAPSKGAPAPRDTVVWTLR